MPLPILMLKFHKAFENENVNHFKMTDALVIVAAATGQRIRLP
jgi:hypothetical protein